jgi:putative DNA methylase
MAIAAEGDRRRTYLPPTPEHERAADIAVPDDVPDTELPEKRRAAASRPPPASSRR